MKQFPWIIFLSPGHHRKEEFPFMSQENTSIDLNTSAAQLAQ
jgi:hypothetical protein